MPLSRVEAGSRGGGKLRADKAVRVNYTPPEGGGFVS